MSERGGNADHVIVKLYIDISKYNFYNNGPVSYTHLTLPTT